MADLTCPERHQQIEVMFPPAAQLRTDAIHVMTLSHLIGPDLPLKIILTELT